MTTPATAARPLTERISKRTGKPIAMCQDCGYPKKSCRCLELALLFQVKVSGLPDPTEQYAAIPGRKWRWDLAWPEPQRLLVEIHGGQAAFGAHSRPAGAARDAEKLNEATLAGFRVLVVTGTQVRSGEALRFIERAIQPADPAQKE